MLVGIGYEAARARGPVRGTTPPDEPVPEATFGAGAATAGGPAHAAHPGLPALLLPQRPGFGVAFWVAVPVAAVVVDLAARRSGGRIATAEELVRFASTSRTVHVVLVLAWAYAGYHLFAR